MAADCGRSRSRGERWIEASDFFVGALTTALAADEMLTEVELPAAPPRSGSCFMEVSRRRGDFAMMGVACTVRLDADGRCAQVRIALCNAGDGPVYAAQASESLIGGAIDAAQIKEAAKLVQQAIDPGGSIHASKEFQRHFAGVLTTRALWRRPSNGRGMSTDTHDIAVTVNGKVYERQVEARLLLSAISCATICCSPAPMSAASTAFAAPAPSCSTAPRSAPV